MKEKPLKDLVRTIRLKKIPFSAVFEITDRCNLRCLHCYQGIEGKGELTFTQIKSVLDDLEKLGSLKLTLTGGEPTLREDFIEIYFYCHQKKFATTLFTNGTLLHSGLRKAILGKPPFRVECSLYGASGKTHDSITGMDGSFDNTFRNIEWMVQKGIPLVVKSVILSLNVHEMEALSNLCHRLGVTFHPTLRIFPSRDPHRSPERLRLKTEEIIHFRKKKKQAGYNKLREPDPSPEEFICNAGREACSISADGKVYPCVALRWECGDLKKTSFHQIWFHSPILEKIRSYQEKDFRDCLHCQWKVRCNFCPGMGFSEEGDMLIPSREICRLTKTNFE